MQFSQRNETEETAEERAGQNDSAVYSPRQCRLN